MDESFWSTTDNCSEVTYSIPATSNSTNSPPTTSTSPARETVSVQTVAAVCMVIYNIGTFANAGALAVIIRVRRVRVHSGTCKPISTLIENQSVMDLFACATGLITVVVMLIHGFKYNGNRIVDGAICVLFEGVALTTLRKTEG